jgi:UDP-2,3-diacylglucosamine pyrophosphatase LpxH
MSLEEMIKKTIIIPDAHLDGKALPKPYRAVKNYIAETGADEVILLGDFADIAALSAWDMDKKRLMEGRRYKEEIKQLNDELDFLQSKSDNVVYLEGNHEDRINRYLDKNPEFEGMIELPEVLDLDVRGIKFIKMNDLYKSGRMYFTHGMWTTKYHANKHLVSLGCNITYGHTHRAQTDTMTMAKQKPHQAFGLGCLCDTQASYLRNRPSSWINQFAVMYSDTKTGNFTLQPINVVGNQFILDGVKYKA